MVQVVKCLLHKLEELNLELQHLQTSTETHVFNPSSGKAAETGELLELIG